MTKIITRYFESAERAQAVEQKLLAENFAPSIIRVYTSADGLADALAAQQVDAGTAKAYEERMSSGGAVVLVTAGHRPLNVARTTRDVMSAMGAADMGGLTEEVKVKESAVSSTANILKDHPLMLSRRGSGKKSNHYMADWPIPHLSRRKPRDAFAFPRHARMAAFPIPLISRIKPRDEFAFPRHARMANWPFRLTIRRQPSDNFLFPRHSRMANWPIPLLSKREPYKGSLIPKHQRMATWPFPLLINGKTGTNALMPGGPRMAAFPMDLLSDRKPADKFAFPRHARMANFPLPLVSKRKPRDKFAFPRHARMANFLLPLVIKHREDKGESSAKGFSFSKMLGLPTLSRR